MNTNADSSPTQLHSKKRATAETDTANTETGQAEADHRDTGNSGSASPDSTSSGSASPDSTSSGSASPGADEVEQESDYSWRARFELAAVERAPREKRWSIPPQADKGPVNITLQLPEVRVDDSGGRHIRIGPEQADVLGSRLVGIRDWLQEGHEDWVGDDVQR